MSGNKEEIKDLTEVNTEELKQEQGERDERDSTCSTSTEGVNEPRKELGLVISALQSTVKQNSENQVKHEYDINEANELHSDIEDIQSVTTTESNTEDATNTNQEKVIEIKHIEQSHPEITSQVLQDITEADEPSTVGEISTDEVRTSEENNLHHGAAEATSSNEEKLHDITDEITPPMKEATDEIIPPTPGIAPRRQTFELQSRNSEDALDTDGYSENLIALNKINIKDIKENTLSPRQQEKADEPILRAIRHLFNNRFMKAKKLFEKQAEADPLHALGLGSMTFLKAIMTTDEMVTKNAIDVLTTAYSIANAQIDAATKKTVGNSVYQAMSSYYNYIKFARASGGLPASPKPATMNSIRKEGVTFIPNGVLRAHVAKAECCLQIAILQLLQENVMGYIRCGLNLRRAYTSYSLVWQEYKRMGQVYHEFIDRDTISGIQFGIGAVHLVLSTLPQKVLRIVSAFGWKADKHLGFALLKLCVEERRIRSPMASLVLLAYYTVLTTLCPQILSNDYTQPAIETLLDAQRTFPNSAFFLYYAGRTSRLARNLTLSTQSFTYAIEISKKEWAEVEVMHVCSYEIGFNYMIEHNWEEAAKIFDALYRDKYWSPAIFKFLTAACLDMMEQRTEAILAFAEVPRLVGSKTQSTMLIEKYIQRKVESFQASGYQDMDMSLCAFEYLYLYTGFDFMSSELLERSVTIIDRALANVMDAEKAEFSIRTQELLPETPPPKYYDQRGILLLMKAALYNALGDHKEAIIHLNWIIDHKKEIDATSFIVPYAYWEAGVTAWGLDNKVRSRIFWEAALKFNKFDFEYRLSMRVNLAITKADELGVPLPEPKDPLKRHQQNKKEPIIVLDSIQSRQHEEEQEARTKAFTVDPIRYSLY